jgi:hypothetical protein
MHRSSFRVIVGECGRCRISIVYLRLDVIGVKARALTQLREERWVG